ncbi:glycosyltransferase [Sphingomonas sp.]|uniref:glycosyltransferase n=1 Tax=Sphingomonas sp. TaxID=28214 RepID=UPI001B03B07C|nr:glycosyltransferase [Sphingomonas sp.]MBO9713021.1 glycosyltransferase [Sphingomonas sp.]
MRIVDVNEYYSPTGGGVRTYLDRKMAIMAEMGHELVVVAAGREEGVEERPGGGVIHWLKSPVLPLDTNYCVFIDKARIRAKLDELRPDVVETSAPWGTAWAVAEWPGNALKVYFGHNDNIGAYFARWLEDFASVDQVEQLFGFYTRYMGRFLQYFDAFVTNGPELAIRHERRGLKVHAAMPLGIETGYFSPRLRDERLRETLLAQLGLPKDGHLLLGLGRHHPEKRWPLVIDAAEAAGTDLPVGLLLIGDGIHRRRIEKRVADSPHVRMFRPVYDRIQLSRIMASCDALIHGSDAEPFGLVGSEAIASGLPLIVPDTGGLSHIADPLFAEKYRARDPRSAADAIRRMFAREPAILRAAAVHAASKVRTDRDHAEALVDCYQEMLDARAGRTRRYRVISSGRR